MTLSQTHLDDLRKSGLSNVTIELAGFASVNPAKLAKLVSPNPDLLSAFSIPYPGCNGFTRYRAFYKDGKSGPRYLQAKDSGNHLYLPHILDAAVLQDPTIDLYITEGEKKALAACQKGLPCIAVSGLWNWSAGNKRLLEDFNKILLQGRNIDIVPDNDYRSRNRHGYEKNLVLAVQQLADRLRERGARVFIVSLPEAAEKIGLDDFLCRHSVDDFGQLPLIECLPLDERVSGAGSVEEVSNLVREIAQIRDTVSQAFLLNKLVDSPFCREHRIGRQALKRDLKRYTQAQAHHQRDDSDGGGVTYATTMEGLVDIVLDAEEKPLMLFKRGEEVKAVARIKDDGQLIISPEKRHCRYLMGEAEEILKYYASDTDAELYQAVLSQLKAVSVLPTNHHYHLIAIYIFFSYLWEKVSFFPYIWFLGPPERGKSRMANHATILSYRGLVTETLNEAFLFRYSERFNGTICFDLYEISERAQGKDSYDLILSRYQRSSCAIRVDPNKYGTINDLDYYTLASPSFLCTNVEIPAHDPLRSRCLRIVMPEKRGRYPDFTSDQLQDLKNRLLAFRTRHFDKDLPVVEKPTVGRLGDIMHPLLQVAQLLPAEASKALIKLTTELESERTDAEKETLAGLIVQALHELESEVVSGRLPFDQIRNKVNEGVEEKYHRSPQKIGRELSVLGIRKIKSNGSTYIVWEPEVMREIFKRYSLPINGTNGTNGTNDAKSSAYTDNSDSADSADLKNGTEPALDLSSGNSRESADSADSAEDPEQENIFNFENGGKFETGRI